MVASVKKITKSMKNRLPGTTLAPTVVHRAEPSYLVLVSEYGPSYSVALLPTSFENGNGSPISSSISFSSLSPSDLPDLPPIRPAAGRETAAVGLGQSERGTEPV